MVSRVCKCIDPPNKYFVKGETYKWLFGIDCVKVYGNGGVVWVASEIRFLLHFSNEVQKNEVLSK